MKVVQYGNTDKCTTNLVALQWILESDRNHNLFAALEEYWESGGRKESPIKICGKHLNS